MMTVQQVFRSGLIAIIGRPNVGKSTLLNQLIGQKLSITSRKAQTTRHRILGIRSEAQAQYIFVDTPGLQYKYRSGLHSAMQRVIGQSLQQVDVVMLVMDARQFTAQDKAVLALLPSNKPVILVLNKVDLISDKASLLPHMAMLAKCAVFHAIVPLSAAKNQKIDVLLAALHPLLPYQERLYPEEQITDRSERFLAAELVREKIFRLLGDELPYATTVVIDKFEEHARYYRIFVSIIVHRNSHKGVLIGKHGEKLKQIASRARCDMQRLFARQVYLEVWVKVRQGWFDDGALIRDYGYD